MGNKKFITPPAQQRSGSVNLYEAVDRAGIDYPIFCFRHLMKDYDFENCKKDLKFLKGLVQKLRILSAMSWDEIRLAPREGSGSEKIERTSIRVAIPKKITKDVNSFLSFRFAGNNGRMIGWLNGVIFHVAYLDTDFSVYKH